MTFEEKQKEIKMELKKLRAKCIEFGFPMVAVVQMKNGNKTQSFAQILSPATLDFETKSTLIYDISNIIQGDYITVPKEKIVDPEEEGYKPIPMPNISSSNSKY